MRAPVTRSAAEQTSLLNSLLLVDNDDHENSVTLNQRSSSMSRPKVTSSFASRTAFDVLAPESDESEEEQITEDAPAVGQQETEVVSLSERCAA